MNKEELLAFLAEAVSNASDFDLDVCEWTTDGNMLAILDFEGQEWRVNITKYPEEKINV